MPCPGQLWAMKFNSPARPFATTVTVPALTRLFKAQICAQSKDPARNGGRHTGEQIIEHMKVDPLVLWAWNPGANRTTPPLSHEQLVTALETWVSAGMPCPPGG